MDAIDKSRTTDLELYKLGKKYGLKINDITNKDLLNQNLPVEGAYIINLQDSTDGFGSHWTIIELKRYKNKPFALYYDSLGFPPPNDVMRFARRFGAKELTYQTKTIQNMYYGGCGAFVIDFIRHLQHTKDNPIKIYNNYISQFYSY
jgi:hypothetical protein